VKGEGFASDLSDTEMRMNLRMKKKMTLEHNPKRPTTPIDIRLSEQVKKVRDPVKNIKHHHMVFWDQEILIYSLAYEPF
jgi:hypothetical protein